jgi:hypothetical protein
MQKKGPLFCHGYCTKYHLSTLRRKLLRNFLLCYVRIKLINQLGVLLTKEFEGVQVDLHEYQCFGEYWNDLADQDDCWDKHLKQSCDHGSAVEAMALWSVTGEFSLAVTDCQQYLNGGFSDPYIPPGY